MYLSSGCQQPVYMAQALFHTHIFQQLQEELLLLQGLRAPLDAELQDTGLGIINQSFPHHAFPVGAVHELMSSCPEDAAATTGFIAGILGTLMRSRSCLWVSRHRNIFPPALSIFGITPDQVLFVEAPDPKMALWAIEEGLKCETLAAVVGEVQELGFTASRRLQLAVEKSRVTGFIHHRTGRVAGNLACVSRWRIKPVASAPPEGLPGVGFPCWNVELCKIRNGRPGTWKVQWTPQGFYVLPEKKIRQEVIIKKAG
ncbi:Error-prone repair protein ImuA [Niabella sp. CC-SYL272]|uniref:ImuA family protein n=1 Tax=Niabella agricola TaxID=2891571 RepID=UPI001F41C381|nr:Error-prone repair protein ImuA [Niabella agricola]MCF3110671.1 Error-prone repair protein ImuA [Niabella agricola]